MGATGFNNYTDLYKIHNVVQNSMIRYSKDVCIAGLRELFKSDSLYHFVPDEYGFNQVVDHTDLPADAGLHDNLTTRVYIGEWNRYDVIYYPSVLVKSSSWRQVPIDLSRNHNVIHYETIKYVDNFGNQVLVQQPSYIALAGAWEGSLTIDVLTKGIRERDDLVEIISLYFTDIGWMELFKSGVSIKPDISISGPSETVDRGNGDKLFRQQIVLNIRTEWRREIPIFSFLDKINFCVDFVDNINEENPSPAPNLTVNTNIDYIDALSSL